jgi:HK97 gp10 family phage protein
MSIKITGLNEVKGRISPSSFDKLQSNIVLKVGNFFETKAKKNLRKSVYESPITWYTRSGKAQQSIVYTPLGKNKAKVFMGVNYGKYLEYGTGIYHTPSPRKPWLTTQIPQSKGKLIYMRGMRARPFWRPTIKETIKEIQKI